VSTNESENTEKSAGMQAEAHARGKAREKGPVEETDGRAGCRRVPAASGRGTSAPLRRLARPGYIPRWGRENQIASKTLKRKKLRAPEDNSRFIS